jgi:sensor domain CHASE-containing protein
MVHTTTTSRRSNPVAVAGGMICVLTGATVLAGYSVQLPAAVTLWAGSAPMRVPTAAGMLICGLSLLAIAAGRLRSGAVIAAVAVMAGLEMLAESAFNLPMQEFEARLWSASGAAAAARRATLTGVCVLLSGMALLLMSGVIRVRRRLAVVGLAGSIVVSVGAVAFLSYLTGMSSAFAAGYLTTVSAPTAFCLLALGAAIIRFAWRDSATKETGSPAWLPLLVGVGSLAVTFCLWEAVVADQRETFDHKVEYDAAYLRGQIETGLENRIQPLIRLARRRAGTAELSQADWDADVQMILTRGGYQAVEWVDATPRAVWVTPPGAGDTLSDGTVDFETRRREALQKARENRVVTFSRPIDLVTGGKGFLACVPVMVQDVLQGYVVGVFRYKLLFASLLDSSVAPRYSLSVLDGDQEILRQEAGGRGGKWGRQLPLSVHGAPWRLDLWPGGNLLEESDTALSGAMLIAGALLSVLFALLVRLVQARRPGGAIQIAGESAEASLPMDGRTPLVTYDRDGNVQAVSDAARELFAGAPPRLEAAANSFRMLRLMVMRAETNTDLRTMLDACALPAIAFGPDGAFTMCNPAATRLLGWTDAFWRGRSISSEALGLGRTECVVLIQGLTRPA